MWTVRTRQVQHLRHESDAKVGRITMRAQVQVIARHIDDALARGGRAVVGGPESVRPPFVHPVVLVDVPDDSDAIREETFGPTWTITQVADSDEAVSKANTGNRKDVERVIRLVRLLRTRGRSA